MGYAGRSTQRFRMQGVLQHAARAIATTTAAGADAELLAQFSQALATFGNSRANILFGDGIADADEHEGFRSVGLLGQDQLALARAPQAIGFALMGDFDFTATAEQ